MGDRANVKVVFDTGKPEDEEPCVYLYTHWRGSDLPEIVRVALARKQRWDDAPYLARIVFCEMVRGAERDETGFGISSGLCDNGHPIIVLDVARQLVRFEDEDGRVIGQLSFPDYIRQVQADYPRELERSSR